jgi:hypothetical protein
MRVTAAIPAAALACSVMSDAILAAIIAATATLCASFLQLRIALAREADARSRGQPISRRRSRLPMILIGIMLFASAVGGFALSQWLGSSQRVAQADLQRELRERVAELGAAVAALQHISAAAAVPAAAPAVAEAAAPAGTAATLAPTTAPTLPVDATPIGNEAMPASAAPPPQATSAIDGPPILAQAPAP